MLLAFVPLQALANTVDEIAPVGSDSQTTEVASVTDETQVAMVNGTGYATFAEALEAAKALTGDVTVEIYDKVTLNSPISGSFDSITFVGKDTDAEIYLDVQGYITATGKKVAFEDLILSKSAGGHIYNAGFMNVAFGVYDVVSVNYTNCTFVNGAYASSGNVTFTKCTFYRSHDKYGLWAYGDVNATVDGCVFADYRGIKMYAEGAAKTTDLTVKNTNFSAVSDKPAIVLTYGESVTLEGNTYSSTGTFELDLDGAPNGVAVTSDVAPTCKNDNGACGVLVDGKIYTTVAQAAAVAESGSTVTLLHASTETVELAEGVTLDKNGFEADGVTVATPAKPVASVNGVEYATLEEAFAAAAEGDTIVLLGDATPALTSQRAITKASVIDLGGYTLTLTEDDLYFGTTTFKNGTIVVDPSVKPSTAVFWMFANQTLTFDGVKLVATGVTGTYLIGLDGNNSDLNIVNGSEIVVENTTALDLDIICVNASTGNDIVVDNSKVNVTNLDGRVFFRGNYTISGTSEIVLEGITKAGIRIEAGQTLSIEDTASVTITGEPRDGGIHITDATATYTKADTATVNATVNAPAVAQIGDVKYATLEEAIAAAKADDEVVLLADVTLDSVVTLPAGIILNGNGKTINGTIKAGGDLTFAGATTVGTFNPGWYNNTITIGEGASLKVTSGRMTVSYGNIFNITGSVADAKTADKTTITPSLELVAGISFNGDGAGVQFNVTNAYVVLGDATTKNSGATGEFNLNFTNSIVDFTKTLKTYMPTVDGLTPAVKATATGSVVSFASHLELWDDGTVFTLDNSNVTVGGSFANAGEVSVTNGSNFVVKAPIMSSHGGNTGSINVTGGTFELVDSNQNWVNEGTMSVAMPGKLIVNDFDCGTNGKITIDATNMNVGDSVTDYIVFGGDTDVVYDAIQVTGKNLLVNEEGALVAPPVAFIGSVGYSSLLDALGAAQDGETVVMNADAELYTRLIFSLYTNGRNVTLDGNGYRLYASSTNWGTGNGKHLINVNCDNVTLKDIVLDSNNIAEGANIYKAQNITFDNVSIINKKGWNADLTVNGSTLKVVNKLSASYVDVDLGSGVTTPLGITAEEGAVLDTRTLQIDTAAYPNTNLDKALSTDGTAYYALKKVDANGNLAGYTNSLSRLSNGYGYELLEDLTVNSNVTLLNAGHTGTINTNGYTLTVADGKALTVNGDLTVEGTGTVAGDIKLGNADASVSGVAGLEIESTIENSKVEYINGEYVVVMAVAKIDDAIYYSVAEALTAAKEAGITDLVITIIGTNDASTADTFDLVYVTAFDSVTIKQDNGGAVYYFDELYTGARTNNGSFIFDGVNIKVTEQYFFEGNVKLTNNSVVDSDAEANCFYYYCDAELEAGSKILGVIEDFRGGSLTIDGGRNDGEFNVEPDFRDAILTVQWSGASLTIKNGAYANINSANEIGRVTIASGASINVTDSKFDSWQWIKIDGTLNVNVNSLITTKAITGSGKIVVDVADLGTEAVTVIKADLSGFTGTIEVINGNATVEKTADGLVVEKTLAGTGTEEDPYIVGSIDDLFTLAAEVNGGNNYKGMYVKLTADIDFNEIATYSVRAAANWEPIGTVDAPFSGTFDGNGKVISNIIVGDGSTSYVGLFGKATGATIKNVTVNNITATGISYVGGIVGMGYTGTIENCHVTGDIKIYGNYMVGGINGQGYAVISNSSVIGNGTDSSYIVAEHDNASNEGDNVGGIVGHNGENNHLIGNTVKNILISGTRKVGGIVGITSQHSKVENCVVENVVIETTATVDYANDNLKTMSIGGLVGQYQNSGSNGTVNNCTVKGVTFNNVNNVTVSAGALVGGTRGTTVVLEPTGIAASGNAISSVTGATNNYFVAAQIGNSSYSTLEEAFAAAAEGDTIVLLSDATPALTSQRAITKASVIDLNGNTLTLTEDDLYFGTTTFKNGTIVVDPSVKPSTAVFWMFANQTLTFDNVELVATGVTGTYLIGLDGNNSDLNIVNGSEIVVDNTTALDLDIICVNASTGNDIVVDNSKVTVNNLDGRVFFRGNYTVSGASEITLTGITKAGIRIEAGQTLSIEDTSAVTISGELRDGGIHLTDTTATYTKEDTATVTSTVNIPALDKEYEIGAGKEFATLADAINDAKAYIEARPYAELNATFKIYGAAELETSYSHGIVDFGATSVVIEGADENAKLTIVGGGVSDIKGVTIKNITFADEGAYLPTANEFMYQNFIDTTFENVVFEDGIRLSGNCTLTNCTVNANTTNEYAIWLDDGNFTITGTSVTVGNDGYGMIKSDVADKITLTDNTFTYTGNANKEALNTKGATIIASGNTFVDCSKGIVPADKTNYTADGTTVITDAIVDDNNTVIINVAEVNGTRYETLADAFKAAVDGDKITILTAGKYSLYGVEGKDVEITGAVDGVEFEMGSAQFGTNASLTFNNVTFNWAANGWPYHGLQHCGDMKYNNCTINGTVFLYGTSEIFNNCEFNVTGDTYNVWTYSAKYVEFNGCTFNSDGKSVLIYHEGATVFNEVAVKDCEFKASQAVDGKAAIEMDSSYTAGIKLTIDDKTTATGFAAGNVSGNSLWNNKKDNNKDENNDITVVVGSETVLAPVTFVAKIGNIGYTSIADAIKAAKANDTVTVLAGNYTTTINVDKAIVLVGETDAEGNNLVNITGKLNVTANGATVKNLNVNNGGNTAGYISAKDVLIEGCKVVGGNGFRYCYTSGTVTFKDSIITGDVYGIHFDGSAGGNIVINNCVITGWTSFGSTINKVTISDSEFADGYYDQLRFYQDVEITNTKFNPEMTIDFGKENVEASFEKCTVTDGSALTDVIYLPDIAQMGIEVVVDGEKVVVEAMVGDTAYLTLQEAINAAANASGTVTVVLTDDVTLSESLIIPAPAAAYLRRSSTAAAPEIVLDLNGKTINAAWADEAAGKHLYAITNNGTLVITGNGTINSRGIYNYGNLTLESGTINAIDANGGYGVQCLEGATFTMNGGAINTTNEDGDAPGAGYDATTVRVEEGATFVMNGGTINNISNFTFAIDNHGTATIKGGNVTSVHSTVANYGTLTIYGGTFTCNGLEGVTAHAIWAADGTTTIYGGTFDGKDNFNGFNVDASEGATVYIKGGYFANVHSGSLYGEGTIVVSGGVFFDEISADRLAANVHLAQNGDVYVVEAHTVAIIPAVDATCTSTGLTAGVKCSVCNEVLVEQTEIAKLPHVEVIIPAVAPDCINTGLTEGKYCAVCGTTTKAQETVDALGHSYTSVVTAPNCTDKGYTTYTCSVCGDTYVDNYVDALGHSYTAVVTAPNCTDKGYTTYTCSVCGDTYVDNYVDALGHTEEIIPAVAPTFDAAGSTEGKKCSVCGEILVAPETIPALKAVAQIGDTKYGTLAEAVAAAIDGNTIVLLSDVTIDELIKIEQNVTVDLGGHKVTSTAKKAFEVYANATITNGTIEAVNRCVDTRKAVELTLTDVNLIADKYSSIYENPQPLTIGGSENGTKVTLNNVNIGAEDGYAIITFVKTDLTAIDSELDGYNALYVKPGSEGSSFEFKNSVLTGSTLSNDVEGNSFSVIAIRANDTTVVVDKDSAVIAEGNYNAAISLNSTVTGASVTLAGTIEGNLFVDTDVEKNTLILNSSVADKLGNDFEATNAGDGLIQVVKKTIKDTMWYGISLTVNKALDMNFYVFNEKLDANSTYYAKVIKVHTDNCNAEPEISYIAQSEWLKATNGNYSIIVVEDIAAKEMNCDIQVQIYKGTAPAEGAEEGEITGDMTSMSIVDYAMYSLNTTENEEFKVLLVDMLNYGAEAQLYFDHDKDELANRDLTEEQKALATNKIDVSKAVLNKPEKYFDNISLTLEHTIFLELYFKGMEDIENYDQTKLDAVISYTAFDGKYVTYVIENKDLVFDPETKQVIVQVNTLSAADVDTVVTCELRYEGTTISKVTTNIAYYCFVAIYYKLPESKICGLIMKYGKAAYNYFN
ncbi:MAG: right-handed parallel beta-helix repeat-containing protein [Clostridia bacterium]|nr:right-handed parallel beta-helix repeat-containing protein [Clostridia bacterium]